MTEVERAIENIRHTAASLPKTVGYYHRTTLYEAVAVLEKEITELKARVAKYGEVHG